MALNTHLLADLAERAAKTFLQGFLAALVASLAVTQSFSVSGVRAILVGALAAGFSAIMSLLSAQVGNPATASLLPSLTPGGLLTAFEHVLHLHPATGAVVTVSTGPPATSGATSTVVTAANVPTEPPLPTTPGDPSTVAPTT
jgi:hypothetical protein